MDISVINKLQRELPQHRDEINRLAAFGRDDGAKIKVVVYGTYNSGKSSLLNSLTDNCEHEYFKVNDVPETRERKTLEHSLFVYTDTPGLDVNQKDTSVAEDEVSTADVILLVHKLTSGPIQGEDLSTFSQIIRLHGRPENIFFIVTASESANDDTSLISELTAQVKSLLGREKEIYFVSNSRYQKGVAQGKENLKQKSGIPELKNELEIHGEQLVGQLSNLRAERKGSIIDELLSAMIEKINALQLESESKIEQWQNYADSYTAEVKSLQNSVTAKLIEYDKIS